MRYTAHDKEGDFEPICVEKYFTLVRGIVKERQSTCNFLGAGLKIWIITQGPSALIHTVDPLCAKSRLRHATKYRTFGCALSRTPLRSGSCAPGETRRARSGQWTIHIRDHEMLGAGGSIFLSESRQTNPR